MPIHAVVATMSYVKARHKTSIFPLVLLHSQPVTVYNGLKNKYCDGQRDSSVHGCQLLRAMAVKTLMLLQATCDTRNIVICTVC